MQHALLFKLDNMGFFVLILGMVVYTSLIGASQLKKSSAYVLECMLGLYHRGYAP